MKRWFLTLSPPLFSFLPRKILHKDENRMLFTIFSISSFFFCSESKNFTKKKIQIQPKKSKQVWMYFLPSSYSSTYKKGIKTEFERYSIIFHKKIWKLCTLVHPCQAFPSLQSHIKILYGSWKCYASRSFKTILYFFIYLIYCWFFVCKRHRLFHRISECLHCCKNEESFSNVRSRVSSFGGF